MENVDVVVIDDDQGVCRVMSVILTEAQISHAVANDGLTGISLVERSQSALAVVDIKLGTMNGVDVAKQINKLSRDTKNFFVTGYTGGLSAHVADLPLAGILEKPFDMLKFIEIIKNNITSAIQG